MPATTEPISLLQQTLTEFGVSKTNSANKKKKKNKNKTK